MSYDNFKNQLFGVVKSLMPNEAAQIISIVDLVAKNYDFTLKETSKGENQKEDAMFTLDSFIAAKSVEEKSTETLKLYKSVLSGFISHYKKPLSAISHHDIREYLSYCKDEKNHASATLGNTRRIIGTFCEWCNMEGIIASNPVKRIASIKPTGKGRHAMQRIELEHLRASAADVPRDKALIDFLFSTGARVSEVCNMKLEDIDWEHKTVYIRNGKGNKSRITYLNPESQVSLRTYLDTRTDNSPYIFTRERTSKSKINKPLTPKTIQDMVQKIVVKSGRTYSVKITPHVFRHTVATIALHNGMPLDQVRKFLGHANINTTLLYAETCDEDVQRYHTMCTA